MKVTYTLDSETVQRLEALAASHFTGNRSAVIRAAVADLWSKLTSEPTADAPVILGYRRVTLTAPTACGECGQPVSGPACEAIFDQPAPPAFFHAACAEEE
jgi:hypothetical protein